MAEKQLWARTSYDFTTLQGKQRFGTDVQSGFIQVGKDLGFRLNQDNSQQYAGLMFTYGWAKSKFFDKFRAENGQVVADKYTGKSHTDMLSVGGYHTYYGSNGFYVDTVAQLSWLQNRYNSIDNTKAKQNGVGVAASIEVGKSFPLLNPKLAIEPQAQLTYQRVWLNGFNDGTREVKKGSQDNITARLGARVIWNESLENNASQLYFTANLIQTLKGRDSNIQVGNQSVSERYGDLSAEFGIGGQYPINPNLSLYADVRYVIGMQDHSQTHKNSQLSRQSYNGRIGLRYSF